MFTGKESSNRIVLSRLVQELLNFGVFGFLQLLGVGWGMGVWGWELVEGASHTQAHAHMCMHTCTCMHGKHGNFMQMAAPIGGIPGNSLCCHTRMCAHACMCMWVGYTLSPPPPIHPPLHPPGGTPRIIHNSIALELIEILHCLKICGDSPTHGWLYNLVGGWWVDRWGQVKSLKI